MNRPWLSVPVANVNCKRLRIRKGVRAGPIGSSPNRLGYPSWEEGCRSGMSLSDGAAQIAPGLLGFAQGCGGRAVKGIRLNHDEKWRNAGRRRGSDGRGERKELARGLYWAKRAAWEHTGTRLISGHQHLLSPASISKRHWCAPTPFPSLSWTRRRGFVKEWMENAEDNWVGKSLKIIHLLRSD